MNGNLQPFVRGTLPPIKPREFIQQQMDSFGVTREEAKSLLRQLQADEIWMNDEYQVNIDKGAAHGFPGVRVWHLSIKRRDKAPLHDWRDLQAIKSALCGPEVEAIELYPAESRVVDTVNQYHLWAFMPKEDGDELPRVPLGWTAGLVMDEAKNGGVQRPRSNT